ncbi:nucleotidyl transferase AbiEii/AbiGii toxin family protein, partial [Salmonella enterica subsp. enterica]|nr:nucleotidyl transferase AbiEii/AbiGii toxin family protein [Salmonella enterica subsp. enterica]
MDLRDGYARLVRLLMAALPHVAKESCFALKGGTAINLFGLVISTVSWLHLKNR